MHCFVLITYREQFVFRHDVLARRFHVIFKNAGFDDGVDRTSLFTEAAVNAFE